MEDACSTAPVAAAAAADVADTADMTDVAPSSGDAYEQGRLLLQPEVLPERLRRWTPEHVLAAMQGSHRAPLRAALETVAGELLRPLLDEFADRDQEHAFLDELFQTLYASSVFLRWTQYEDALLLEEREDTCGAEHIPPDPEEVAHGRVTGLLDRFDAAHNLYAYAFGWVRLEPVHAATIAKWAHERCGGRILEIGAGSGALAQTLRRAPYRCDVRATDKFRRAGNAKMYRVWSRLPACRHGVDPGDEQDARGEHTRALLLCYPNEFAADALHAYPGPLLLYIGGARGGPTASERFFDWLAQWRVLERVPVQPFAGNPLAASLWVLERRAAAETPQRFDWQQERSARQRRRQRVWDERQRRCTSVGGARRREGECHQHLGGGTRRGGMAVRAAATVAVSVLTVAA